MIRSPLCSAADQRSQFERVMSIRSWGQNAVYQIRQLLDFVDALQARVVELVQASDQILRSDLDFWQVKHGIVWLQNEYDSLERCAC